MFSKGFFLGECQNCNCVAEMMTCILEKVEKNGSFQHFSYFPTMFSNAFFLKVIETWGCVGKALKSTSNAFSYY